MGPQRQCPIYDPVLLHFHEMQQESMRGAAMPVFAHLASLTIRHELFILTTERQHVSPAPQPWH